MEFDHAAIQKILPHRSPFLFIDRVVNVVPGESGIGIKQLCANELLLSANAMAMPNILHLEIMAQTTAIICAALALNPPEKVDEARPLAGMGYLAGGDIDFISSKSARAGETLESRVTITKHWGQFILAQGSIFSKDQELSQGRFTIALADSSLPHAS